MSRLNQAENFFDQNREKWLEEFFSFLKFETISAHKKSQNAMHSCVDWLKEEMEKGGLTVSEWDTISHPVLFGQNLEAGLDRPTLLIYNHYDVQPVDPLNLWESPPFEPTIRNGEIYARGASDDKGQCFYVLKALQAYRELFGTFPINIKLIIEGDEETGSEGLEGVLGKYKEDLKADAIAIVDLGITNIDQPSVTLGVRGIITMDLEVSGPQKDLHSGVEGGVIHNPIHALCDMLASIRDKEGRVQIPDFYSGVKPLSQEEAADLMLEFDHEAYEKIHGTGPHGGEKAFSPRERAWIRPTLEINGIFGGYQEDGFKTVIPAKAGAKISCRLVPGQDPEVISNRVQSYFENNAPEGIKVKVTPHPGRGHACKAEISSPIIQAASSAFTEVFKKKCRFILEGGSIPVVTELSKVTGGDVAFIGVGLPTDQIHAPNEHFGIERLKKGFCIITRMIDLYSNKEN
ncbi:dipeptidase [Chlamydiales bacterium]|nr:dipeptidase [Chlamydiales bacterium]